VMSMAYMGAAWAGIGTGGVQRQAQKSTRRRSRGVSVINM
jgi:hypothetical protein